MKRKILLVSNGFYPEISPRSFRATELAKEFIRQGHEVTVISKFREFDYSAFLKEYPLTLKMWGKTRFKTVPPFRNNLLNWVSRAINRSLLMLFEYPSIEDFFQVIGMLKYERSYNLMISFAYPYPVHWGVAYARSMENRISDIWVADCGDPYMGEQTDSFKKLFYFRYIEKWCFRKCEFIAVPIEEARKAYYDEFSYKIRVIPQGFSFDLYIEDDVTHSNQIPTFAFAGSLTMYMDSAPSFFDLLIQTDFPFLFIIYTENLGWASEYVVKLKDKVEIRSYIPREELIRDLSMVDFVVNFMYNTDVQKSSKLITYAIAQKPILNIEPHKSFTDSFLQFVNHDFSARYEVNDLDQYRIEVVANQFISLI